MGAAGGMGAVGAPTASIAPAAPTAPVATVAAETTGAARAMGAAGGTARHVACQEALYFLVGWPTLIKMVSCKKDLY